VPARQLHLQQRDESVPVPAMVNLQASLVQCTGDLGVPGEKGAMVSLAIPTANDTWKVMGKSMKQRGARKKSKRAWKSLLQLVHKALGRQFYAFVHWIPSHYYS